ncbi:MAG: hypothetical protein N3D15_03690 [Syntrophorhabdaceae bacterium]|nr:hypothetical protein [Syntrophorhabdaceae bacterium]
MNKRAIIHIIVCFFLTCIVDVNAYGDDGSQIAPDWRFSGQNSLHIDYYNSSGPSGSYKKNEGWQPYNDINIQFQNTADSFNTMKGYLSGTINQSPYRASKYGVIPERFNFNQENGKFPVPYRLDLGDFYAFQTPRIIQRSLKGGQIEFQPGTMLGAGQSILLQVGGAAQDYLDNKRGDNLFGGASWMMNWKDTRFAVNYTQNRQASRDDIPSLSQYVWGMALNHNFSLLYQKLVLDAEWNFLRGDIYRSPLVVHNKGEGRFIQLQGKTVIPITYSFRYEDYDAEYVPAGASVSGGRRSFETRANWQSAKGFSINGRAQFYRDGLGTDNITDTDVYGFGISGSIPNPWIKGLSGSLDTYRQHADAPNNETVINSLNAYIGIPLHMAWNLRLSAGFQETIVRKGTATNSGVQQYGMDIGHNTSFMGFTGTANAGVLFIKRRQKDRDQEDYGFNFSTSIGRSALRLTGSYRYYMQNQLTNLMDNRTQGFNVAAEYTYGKNLLRLEGDCGMNQPARGTQSRDTRLLFTWTYSFERPAMKKAVAPEAPKLKPDEKPAPEMPLVIKTFADLRPGYPIKKIQAALADKNIKDGLEQDRNIVYETVWFEDISQRQRLVLTQRTGYLEKATIIIDLQQTGEIETIGQLYRRIQANLTRTFGAPVTQEKGEFGPNIVSDLRNNTFVRISDWTTPYGTLRLGIPRRLDGIVRIEVQHAESFPLSYLTPWGLEEVQ